MFQIAGEAEKVCPVALILNINMYFFSVLICLILLCKFLFVSIHLMEGFWKMRRNVQSRRMESLFISESLGQEYGLGCYILLGLRPLVEIYNSHFSRASEKIICKDV